MVCQSTAQSQIKRSSSPEKSTQYTVQPCVFGLLCVRTCVVVVVVLCVCVPCGPWYVRIACKSVLYSVCKSAFGGEFSAKG